MVHRDKIQISFLTLPILTETRGFRIDHPLDMYYHLERQWDTICISMGAVGLFYFF